MPGTYTPAQMFNFELNQKKGWPSPYAVDYAATIKDGETDIQAGSVISLDANGEFVLALSGKGRLSPTGSEERRRHPMP